MAIYKNTPPIVTNGLVLNLDAANQMSYTSGSTTWRSVPSMSYGCTIFGPLRYNTTSGGGYIFSGSTSYGITNYLAPSPSVTPTTYEITIQPIGSIPSFSGLMGYSGYQIAGFSLGLQANQVIAQGYSGSTGFYIGTASNILSLDRPNYIAALFEYRSVKIYVNNTLRAQVTYNFDPPISLIPIYIGNQSQGGWSNSNHYVFNARVYNRALSEQELTQNYNATKARFGL